jgi:hypothetical protein
MGQVTSGVTSHVASTALHSNGSSLAKASVSACSSNVDFINEINPKFDQILTFNLESKVFVPSYKKPQSLQGEATPTMGLP